MLARATKVRTPSRLPAAPRSHQLTFVGAVTVSPSSGLSRPWIAASPVNSAARLASARSCSTLLARDGIMGVISPPINAPSISGRIRDQISGWASTRS
eukprot:COSAG05_NODE_2387_length_3132_cov_1.598088_3_plen_98_part_00